MAIHRTKEKTQNEREASWGLERRELGGGRGGNRHGGWDSKEKRCIYFSKVSVYCRMQFPLFITISSRALKTTDTN